MRSAEGARGLDALARNMKDSGHQPEKFDALIGAGRAALALGDSQAAAGFFGRAEEVWPASPLAAGGDGRGAGAGRRRRGALPIFRPRDSSAAPQAMIGADRGLAYDLVGQHAQAQADYRAALTGRDGDEARRRLALSLAIPGKRRRRFRCCRP